MPSECYLTYHHLFDLLLQYTDLERWKHSMHQQEIDLLKVLNHKNIVKYLGTLNTKTDLHIILEYVENGSLDNIIKPNKFGPLPESLAAVYIAQVLEGLVYLHDQGVIHRDIKGANILATKEGHVKLTDFGVATKLTEAGISNSSSLVVGTPYWMAPEVIELSGACAQSDIWSVGCTVIELVTSFPPHYDLGHYSALYRIVKDEMPPLPPHLSPELTDFLHQCFKKDAKQRPDAKTLLLHPWLQNSSRSFRSSVRKVSARLSGVPEEVSVDSESSSGDDQGSSESHRHSSDSEQEHEDFVIVSEKDVIEQDPIASSHEKSSANSGSLSSATVDVPSTSEGYREKSNVVSQEVGKSDGAPTSPNSKKETFVSGEMAAEGKNAPRPRMRRRSMRKTLDEKFYAEGLFSIQSLHGTSDSFFLLQRLNGITHIDLRLFEISQSLGGCIFLLLELGPTLGRDAEINKLVGSLKPEEPEDVIVSTCQKLSAFFQEHPDQKIAFITDHGLLPLVDLLEVSKIPVISSVIQIINQIIKDNSHFQEYACSLGLIPIVMNFATPDCPNEVRMQAAYFLQQLCQSSSSTLQMFIACRGIPILVGFLESDYAKRRDMVQLAVDGMWQIFKLPRLTQRNDFCRIAAMNGILSRLVNIIHSLNDATRTTPSSGNTAFSVSGSARQQPSLPKDRSQPGSMRGEPPKTEDPSAERNLETSGQLVSHGQAQASVSYASQRPSTELQRRNSTPSASVKVASQDYRRLNSWSRNSSQAGDDLVRQQGRASPSRLSSSKSLKQGSNGIANSSDAEKKQLLPVMSLLEKEPPSRLGSHKFEYATQNSGMVRQNSILPLLLESTERKSAELDLLITEFAETKRISASGIGSTSFSGRTSSHAGTSQATSNTLPGSSILNARTGCNASCGLSPETTTVDTSVAREYLEKVADLLLEFAQADTRVKSHMCRINLLNRLFYMLKKLEIPILLKRVNAIKHLVPNLELCEHPLVPQIDNEDIHPEVLSTLFNLCKINKAMQEQAAENGIVPYLMRIIMSDSPLKQYALPLLCDMAQASSSSREQLRACGGLEVYLNLLDDNSWATTALDSLAACLAHDSDNGKIEHELLKNNAIQKLVKFFQRCPDQYFMNILEPFLKILRDYLFDCDQVLHIVEVGVIFPFSVN
ncbi:hypothetical protein ACLOJK_006316 [Asimina triloba]